MEVLTKMEKFLFYFLFFAIPFQIRKILYFPGWRFNEWQSIGIYATDLLLLVLFCFWFHNSFIKKESRIKNYEFRLYDYFLFGFLAVALISVKNSSDFYVGIFLWLKLVEFALFYFYLKSYAIRKFSFNNILYTLIAGGVFQSFIAIIQFLKQGSLGLGWLGESVIGTGISGVASFYIDSGLKIIRAYGTLPHPNILAAYLFLAIFGYYFTYLYDKLHIQKAISSKVGWTLGAGYAVLLFGFFYTFSRTIIVLWFAGFVIRSALILCKDKFRKLFLLNRENRFKLIQILLIGFFVIIIFLAFYWPEVSSRMMLSSQDEAVKLRVFYNKETLKSGLNLFGIGPGDFTGWLMEQNPNLPSYVYQPVHNIYLLTYSEIGIVGLILFLCFLAGLIYEYIKNTKFSELKYISFFLVSISILLVGLFDHFLFTIQQGRFILWLSIVLLTIYQNNDNI